MAGTDREAVVANAKYLRHVRPVDPDEIAEYVEGHPHPGVVRQVLREEAADLGMVERSDGTFVPAPEGSVAPSFSGVEALPERYSRRVEELLVSQYGPDWHRGESGDRLRETIRRLKSDYFRQRDVRYDEDVALAYAVYHLPDFYAVGQYVVDVLGRERLLDRSLRVLDVGAGVGGPALGLHDYLAAADSAAAPAAPASDEPAVESPGGLVAYEAVEPSAAAGVLESLLDETGPNFHPTVHRTTAEEFEPSGEYDLLLFANVCSELADPVAVVERYAESLAPDGTLVLVAPADRNTSIELREIERELADGLSVYAPTVRLWPDRRPTAECWSFDERPGIAVPPFQRQLADAARESGADDDPDAYVNTSVRFSYSHLRSDGRRRVEMAADSGRFAALGDADSFVTERVNLLVAKLSGDLGEGSDGDGEDGGVGEDSNPLFLVSDGSESTPVYAVLVRESSLNRALAEAGYGDVLAFERALVLWNDDEGAYNVVVDEGTVVDLAAAVDHRPGE